MGGMALPDLRSYFMASQLSFLHWRLFPLTPNATSLLEAAVAISQETLQNMLYRKGIPGREVGSVMALPGKVFHWCSKRRKDDPLWLSPNSPLWCKRTLEEFLKLPDGHSTWARHGIKYLHHIYQYNHLCTFAQLREKFGVPKTSFFWYVQVRHAAIAQFGEGGTMVQNTDLEKVLIDPDPAKWISRSGFSN